MVHNRFTCVIEQTADAVFITDIKGVIEYVNPAFESITGYNKSEALGCTPRLLKSGLHKPEYYQDLWKTLLQGHSFTGEAVNKRKNGELFYAEQTITPIRNPRGHITHFVSLLKDMTQWRHIIKKKTELEIASRVLKRLLPNRAPKVKGYEFYGTTLPADVVCGDYYDFLPISESTLGIVIADVSGHGVGPAMVMVETRAYIRSLAGVFSSPSDILNSINNILFLDLNDNYFVTLIIIFMDILSGRLIYANAGHTPAYIYNHEGEIDQVLKCTGVPLGMFVDQKYATCEGLFEPGNMLVLVTDGLAENPSIEGSEFGLSRIHDLIKSQYRKNVKEISECLIMESRQHAGNRPQTDDITLVIGKRYLS